MEKSDTLDETHLVFWCVEVFHQQLQDTGATTRLQ